MTEPDPCPARCGVPVAEHTDDDRALCGEVAVRIAEVEAQQKARDVARQQIDRADALCR